MDVQSDSDVVYEFFLHNVITFVAFDLLVSFVTFVQSFTSLCQNRSHSDICRPIAKYTDMLRITKYKDIESFRHSVVFLIVIAFPV